MKRSPKWTDDGFSPTGVDIRQACIAIQAKWTEAERRKRAGLPKLEPWQPPMVPGGQFSSSDFDAEVEA